MLTTDKIKGIIFDYGGTIDSNGLHWAEVIWKAYEAEPIRYPSQKPTSETLSFMANGL